MKRKKRNIGHPTPRLGNENNLRVSQVQVNTIILFRGGGGQRITILKHYCPGLFCLSELLRISELSSFAYTFRGNRKVPVLFRQSFGWEQPLVQYFYF